MGFPMTNMTISTRTRDGDDQHDNFHSEDSWDHRRMSSGTQNALPQAPGSQEIPFHNPCRAVTALLKTWEYFKLTLQKCTENQTTVQKPI